MWHHTTEPTGEALTLGHDPAHPTATQYIMGRDGKVTTPGPYLIDEHTRVNPQQGPTGASPTSEPLRHALNEPARYSTPSGVSIQSDGKTRTLAYIREVALHHNGDLRLSIPNGVKITYEAGEWSAAYFRTADGEPHILGGTIHPPRIPSFPLGAITDLNHAIRSHRKALKKMKKTGRALRKAQHTFNACLTLPPVGE